MKNTGRLSEERLATLVTWAKNLGTPDKRGYAAVFQEAVNALVEERDRLTAYEQLGPPEYLAALVEEHKAVEEADEQLVGGTLERFLREWNIVIRQHAKAIRLREEGL